MLSYRERVLLHYATRRAENFRPKGALRCAKYDAKYANGGKCPFDNQWGYDGEETRTLPNGWKLVFTIEHDSDCGPPEKEWEGHGPTEWVHRSLEDWESDWVLCWDGHSKLLYDVREARRIAKRDGWCMAKTDTEIAEAVKSDFNHLFGYYNEHWWYVGITVELQDENGDTLDEDSCWGYESNCMDYITSEARSWAAHMVRKHLPAWKKAQRLQREERFWSDAMSLCT